MEYVSELLAVINVLTCMTSVFYYLITRMIGTPFTDSLSSEQKKILQDSQTQRMIVFLISMILSIKICCYEPCTQILYDVLHTCISF